MSEMGKKYNNSSLLIFGISMSN